MAALYTDLRHPFSGRLVPEYSLESRRIVSLFHSICVLSGESGHTQVAALIVQCVTVAVVNLLPASSFRTLGNRKVHVVFLSAIITVDVADGVASGHV